MGYNPVQQVIVVIVSVKSHFFHVSSSLHVTLWTYKGRGGIWMPTPVFFKVLKRWFTLRDWNFDWIFIYPSLKLWYSNGVFTIFGVAMVTANFLYVWPKINFYDIIQYFFSSFLHQIPEIHQLGQFTSMLAWFLLTSVISWLLKGTQSACAHAHYIPFHS